MRPIIVYPLLTWDSELVHRDQMLAKEFAKKGVQTYFINRVTRQPWRVFGKAQIRYADGLTVVSTFTFPYFRGRVPFVYSINNYLIGKQLKAFYQGVESPRVLYISNPDWAQHIKNIKLESDEIIYDISDDYEALAKNPSWAKIVSDHDALARKLANKYVSTSLALLTGAKGVEFSIIVTNGVDLSGFSASKAILEHGKFRKIAGFIGGLYEWVDLELVEQAAKAYRDVLFVLIGPTDRDRELRSLVKENKNVRYLGAKPKKEIGNYFASFDVGLLPFVPESHYPRLATVDSGKIYQYMYFGYPIVSTDYEQARNLGGIVSIAGSDKEFVAALGLALDAGVDENRQNFATSNSWANKATEILEFINC